VKNIDNQVEQNNNYNYNYLFIWVGPNSHPIF